MLVCPRSVKCYRERRKAVPDLVAKYLRTVLDIVYTFDRDQHGGEMPDPVLAQLSGLIGCESVAYSFSHAARTTVRVIIIEAVDQCSGLQLVMIMRYNVY
jgi:hypothetical protein